MSGIFGSSQPAPAPVAPAPTPLPTPVVTPPAVMPDTNSPTAIEAQRRAQAQVLNRAGRTSTILTAPSQRGNSTQGRTNFDSYSSVKTG